MKSSLQKNNLLKLTLSFNIVRNSDSKEFSLWLRGRTVRVSAKKAKNCALTPQSVHFNDRHLFKYLDNFNILLSTFQSIFHDLQTPSIGFMFIWRALSYLLLQLFGYHGLVLKSCRMPFKIKDTLHWFFVTGHELQGTGTELGSVSSLLQQNNEYNKL